MSKNEVTYIKSGGRRLSLYAEIGKYFFPDGQLDEGAFRQFIRKSLKEKKTQWKDNEIFKEKTGEWLSSYLTRIVDYLKEKEMPHAALLLLRIAIEESSLMGLSRIALSADHLQLVLSNSPSTLALKAQRHTSSENRKKIFDAALKLFAEKGFHKTTVDDIVALSGVGKGTVYRNFESKRDLLDNLLMEKKMEIIEILSEVFSQSDNVLQQIKKAIELWVTFIEENHVLYRLIQSEEIFQRAEDKTSFYDTIITNLPMIKERIVALNEEGKLKTTSFYTTFYGILGFIDGVVHKWFRSGMDYPLRDDVPVILEVLFNGFVGEKTSKERFFVAPEEKTSRTI